MHNAPMKILEHILNLLIFNAFRSPLIEGYWAEL